MSHVVSRILITLLFGFPALLLGQPSGALQAAPEPATETTPDAATARLLATLATGSESERESAAFELAETAPAAGLPALVRALRQDESSVVRQAAAFALGAYRPPSPAVIDALMETLRGRDPRLKTAVATTLSRLGEESEAVVRGLVEALGSEDPRTRQSAVIVLERIGPPAAAAIPAVAQRLREDPDERVRRFAVAVLTAMGKEASEGAAEAMTSAAVPALLRAVGSDTSERVRQYSAEALPAVGAPASAAVPVLTEALGDPDWGVRAAAARSLGRYGPAASSAAPALKKAKKDGEEPVREAAREALREIGGRGSEPGSG